MCRAFRLANWESITVAESDYLQYPLTPAGTPTPDCDDPTAQQCLYNRSEWRHGIQIGTEWVPAGHPNAWGPAPCGAITISGGEHGLSILRRSEDFD